MLFIISSCSFFIFIFFFFFNDTATTEIYTLSLQRRSSDLPSRIACRACESSLCRRAAPDRDRKSTRLNSSHQIISYAVFCLKKKKKKLNSYFLKKKKKKNNRNKIIKNTS